MAQNYCPTMVKLYPSELSHSQLLLLVSVFFSPDPIQHIRLLALCLQDCFLININKPWPGHVSPLEILLWRHEMLASQLATNFFRQSYHRKQRHEENTEYLFSWKLPVCYVHPTSKVSCDHNEGDLPFFRSKYLMKFQPFEGLHKPYLSGYPCIKEIAVTNLRWTSPGRFLWVPTWTGWAWMSACGWRQPSGQFDGLEKWKASGHWSFFFAPFGKWTICHVGSQTKMG